MKESSPEIRVLFGVPTSPEGQRAAKIAAYKPVAGAVKAHCSNCGQEVWIGPRQAQELQREPKTLVGCALCLILPVIAGKATSRTISLGGASASFLMVDGTKIEP